MEENRALAMARAFRPDISFGPAQHYSPQRQNRRTPAGRKTVGLSPQPFLRTRLFESSWPAESPQMGATMHESNRPSSVDVAFIEAARSGSLGTIVELLHRASSVNTVVRVKPEGWPVTALHVAAAAGHNEVVSALLTAGADPCAQMPMLRALTPLHVAKDATMCRLLLNAGAPPISLDPRQPDPSKYLRSAGKPDAADAVLRWRAEKLPESLRQQLLGDRILPHLDNMSRPSSARAVNNNNNGRPTTPREERPKRMIVGMSSAQVKLAHEAWTLRSGTEEYDATLKALKEEDECVVCMSSLSGAMQSPWVCKRRSRHVDAAAEDICNPCEEDEEDEDEEEAAPPPPPTARPPLLLLPCGHSGAKPHCLHAHCAERWLLRKASCPVCRRDVRPMLPKPKKNTLLPRPPSARPSRPSTPREPLRSAAPPPGLSNPYSPRRVSRDPSPRNSSRAASPRHPSHGPSPRVRNANLREVSTITMKELAATLPPNRAVGVAGKLWVGWRREGV